MNLPLEHATLRSFPWMVALLAAVPLVPLPAVAAIDGDRDGFTAEQGDCDDSRADVYPGAADPSGDGVDQDCGGTTGPEPHVGLSDASYRRLQDAIEAAEAGTTVWVGPGTYFEWEVSFGGKDITLASTHGPDETTIDARGNGRCVVFESGESRNAVLRGFRITGGSGERGAGINVYQSSPTLEDLVIEGNRASSGGGGFNFYGASPVLRDTVVKGNQALTNVGGGGKINASTGVVLEGVTFARNVSKYEGGGLYVSGSQVELRDSVVKQNTSVKGWGGGVTLLRTQGLVGGAEVTGNRALKGRGGGMYLEDTDILIQGTTVEKNQASLGGGLFLEVSDPIIDTCSVSFNVATGNGGGIYLSYSSPMVKGSTFNGNVGASGGGAYLEFAGPSFDRCTLAWNTGAIGGGIYALSSSATVSQTILLENVSALDGGGSFWMGSTLDLSHTLLSRNEAVAGSGGGLSLWLTTVEADNVALLDNSAGRSGGGAFLSGVSGHLVNGSVVGNDAPEAGGVYLFSPGSSVALKNLVLAYNTPDNLGVDGEVLAPPDLTYSCLHNPEGMSNHNLVNLDDTNVTVEPGFLEYDASGWPTDLHLAISSSLVDAGDPSLDDPDGTVSDPGMYGGPGADAWDLDGDDFPDYFWPGTIEDAPPGVTAAEYDCDDLNPLVQSCL